MNGRIRYRKFYKASGFTKKAMDLLLNKGERNPNEFFYFNKLKTDTNYQE